MPEIFIHRCGLIRIPSETAARPAALEALRSRIGPRKARRMSHLGLALSGALDGWDWDDDPALIYTTTYSEAASLEKFIDSFPFASPLLFQMSIHPGGVEQALIARQQPVTEFLPLAGQRELLSQGLRAALLSPRPRVVWVGGEERGSWLLEEGHASPETFAWALSLRAAPEAALARLSWEPAGEGDAGVEEPCPSTLTFFEALEARRSLSWGGSALGRFACQWL